MNNHPVLTQVLKLSDELHALGQQLLALEFQNNDCSLSLLQLKHSLEADILNLRQRVEIILWDKNLKSQ